MVLGRSLGKINTLQTCVKHAHWSLLLGTSEPSGVAETDRPEARPGLCHLGSGLLEVLPIFSSWSLLNLEYLPPKSPQVPKSQGQKSRAGLWCEDRPPAAAGRCRNVLGGWEACRGLQEVHMGTWLV